MHGKSFSGIRATQRQRTPKQSARTATIIDADGHDVLRIPADATLLNVYRIVADDIDAAEIACRIGRHTASAAYQFAVQVALVNIIGLGHFEDDNILLVSTTEQTLGYVHMDTIPAVCTVVFRKTLFVPLLCDVNFTP